MFALLALLPSHVPTYGGDVENCFKLPHIHTVSQVVYIHGSGGLEIHVEDDTTPFDTQGGELIDFDAVFREEIDQSTYSLYVGCGGCVASQDPLVASSKVELNGYEEVEIEPFTQTAYRSVFPKLNRTFNASLLSAANCDQKHFTIRLVQHSLSLSLFIPISTPPSKKACPVTNPFSHPQLSGRSPQPHRRQAHSLGRGRRPWRAVHFPRAHRIPALHSQEPRRDLERSRVDLVADVVCLCAAAHHDSEVLASGARIFTLGWHPARSALGER